MDLCVLGSGSRGNATLIKNKDTLILIDAGISAKAITTRLAEIGILPEKLDAIIISHEHGDHVNGVRVLTKKFNIPVWINDETFKNIKDDWSSVKVNHFKNGASFKVNSLSINPFYVSHDAEATSAFVIRNSSTAVGVATDLGDYTNLLIQNFSKCDALVLESNYEDELLMKSAYPWKTKKRIRSRNGHLSNERSFELIKKIAKFKRLKHVILAHISQKNNSVEHLKLHMKKIPKKQIKLYLSFQEKISEVIKL